jgi:dolichyl-phosphate-mannose-protein mannosyltransferase
VSAPARMSRTRLAHLLRAREWRWLHLVGALTLYLLLLLPTVGRQGILWDEQTDIAIARAYLQPGGWLSGSGIDPSQTRLPMFTVALVYALLGRSDLITARLVSCAVGLLTLAGAYLACRQRFGHATGILACTLLASSPFFLSFARLGFTETDIYLACALVWLLVCVQRLQERPSIARAAIVGVVLGFAFSAKATAVAVLPAVWLAAAQPGRPAPVQERRSFASPLSLSLLITGLAGLTFLAVPPEHSTNPAILQGLFHRFDREMSFSPGFIVQAAALHVLSILFKSGPLIGAWLLLGWITALVQWHRSSTRFPALVISCYFAGLVLLPLAQTFYTVPLLPLLSVLAADLYVRFFARFRSAAIGTAVLAVILLAFDLTLCYPDYNLNGYQWLGARQLAGRPSIGYRGVVQTPSDGVEQAFRWLNEHAKRGERVRSYALEQHIIQAVAPAPLYRIEFGFDRRASPDPDYVVVEINALIRQDWWTKGNGGGGIYQPPFDPGWLSSNYTKVFVVERAFGIEMASVWQRRT